MHPRISVIIPSFNSEKYIEQALSDVLNQTYKPYEVIVIDDGSTDKTSEIVSKYINVVYYFQVNSGPAAARNHGIKKASGDFIAFIDSDDSWGEKHLENFVLSLRKHPFLVWHTSGYGIFNEKTTKTKNFVSNIIFKKESNLRDYFEVTNKMLIVNSSNVIIKRQILLDLNGFNESFNRGEDLDLWFRIALDFPQIGYSPEITSCYIKRGNTLTSNKINLIDSLTRIERAINYLPIKPPKISSKASPLINKWIYRLLINAIIFKRLEIVKEVKSKNWTILNHINKLIIYFSLLIPQYIIYKIISLVRK